MRTLFFISIILTMLGSCSSVKKGSAADSNEPHTADESNQEMAASDALHLQENDSLLISYERTPCFGRCPVFKIKVYESGYTTYQGVNFVEYMGYFYTRIPASTQVEIKAAILGADFFSLEDRYDNEHVTDLPSKIFEVDMDGMHKRITARVNSPESLNTLAQKLELIFEDTLWKAVITDH